MAPNKKYTDLMKSITIRTPLQNILSETWYNWLIMNLSGRGFTVQTLAKSLKRNSLSILKLNAI